MRRLTAAIVARHANLSSRQHVLRPMELGSGTNGHHVEGFEHQMMGLYKERKACATSLATITAGKQDLVSIEWHKFPLAVY